MVPPQVCAGWAKTVNCHAHPRILLPQKAIAVEDSPTGIASAKAAGLKVLALKPRHGEPLDQSAADCIITKLMDVKEHLD